MSRGYYSRTQIGIRNSASSKTRNNNRVQIGLYMLRVHRRIEKLEHALKVSAPATHVIHSDFVDRDGRVTGTMVSSSDPALCVPYRKVEDDRKEAA
jgi:hypothetical protein